MRYEAFLPAVGSYHIYPVIFTVQNIHHLKSYTNRWTYSSSCSHEDAYIQKCKDPHVPNFNTQFHQPAILQSAEIARSIYLITCTN
jgi:hypothetical protein